MQILKLCGEGKGARLLDIGCARGLLMAELVRQNWNVSGIESHAEDAAIARAAGFSVLNCSVEDALLNNTESYKGIVIADVLEHLVDPTGTLTACRNLTESDGFIIISVPNIAHVSVRIQLLLGRFNYSDSGILDRTHLHFYTKKTIVELVEKCGLSVFRISPTPAPIEKVFPALGRPSFSWVLQLGAKVARAWPSFFGYQFIVVARNIH
jgi:2-polyprenyl-3-methyl-5-hydroxy-6-metoxy-1,4-benzoquinol methylase